MKTYIYTTEKRHTRELNRYCRIYRVKNNVPQYIGEVEFSTGSYRGEDSEVFNKLIEIGQIPKSYYNLSKCEWRGPGYYCKEVEKKGVRIYGMN